MEEAKNIEKKNMGEIIIKYESKNMKGKGILISPGADTDFSAEYPIRTSSISFEVPVLLFAVLFLFLFSIIIDISFLALYASEVAIRLT